MRIVGRSEKELNKLAREGTSRDIVMEGSIKKGKREEVSEDFEWLIERFNRSKKNRSRFSKESTGNGKYSDGVTDRSSELKEFSHFASGQWRHGSVEALDLEDREKLERAGDAKQKQRRLFESCLFLGRRPKISGTDSGWSGQSLGHDLGKTCENDAQKSLKMFGRVLDEEGVLYTAGIKARMLENME